MTDETRVVLRQNLHGLVTGALACMDSGRSTLAKVATDSVGLICEQLRPGTVLGILQQLSAGTAAGRHRKAVPAFAEEEAAARRALFDDAVGALAPARRRKTPHERR
jgi:hypothetical protein